MTEDEMREMAGMLAKITYELHEMDCFNEDQKEMFLDFWRRFDQY